MATKLPTRRRKYHAIYSPVGGLHCEDALGSTLIDERSTPNCSEVLLRGNVVGKNYGSTYFAGGSGTVGTATSGLTGAVQYIQPFYKSDASTGTLLVHIAVTGPTSALLKYNATTKWFEVVAGSTGMTADDSFYVVSENMNDKYIFSNNKDYLRKYTTGGNVEVLVSGTGDSASYTCQDIVKYGERLCLYRTSEGGTLKPQRVRWSIVNGEEDYTGTGSGFADLRTQLGQDFIMSAEKMGNYVIIYGEDTIVLQNYTGYTSSPFTFDTRVSGCGIAAQRAIANLGEEHIFLGWEDIYSYKGGREVTSVADKVSDEIFDVINPEAIGVSFMVHLREVDEILLFIPTAGNTHCNMYYRYNRKNGSWSKGERGAYTGFGFYEKKTSAMWSDMTMQWNELVQRWNSSTLLALAPITLLGDVSGKIEQIDETTQNWSDSSVVNGWWDSKDFVIGEGYKREVTNWMEFNFEGKGNSVGVQYSTDRGVSWSGTKTFQLDASEWKLYNWDIETTGEKIRFRFSNNTTNETWSVRMFELGYLEASDRGK